MLFWGDGITISICQKMLISAYVNQNVSIKQNLDGNRDPRREVRMIKFGDLLR